MFTQTLTFIGDNSCVMKEGVTNQRPPKEGGELTRIDSIDSFKTEYITDMVARPP